MFKPISLFYTDGYKIGHKKMLAPGTQYLYGTWIPRNLKHAPTGVTKVVSFGQQLAVKWIDDIFKENFFNLPKSETASFIADMSMYLGDDFNGDHFMELHDLGYLPIKIKALPEGIETPANVPHMTFVNTVPGFAWLTLYLETILSSLLWKPSTSATIALQYRRNLQKWVKKTDDNNSSLIPFLAHDFSARGLSPWDMMSSGLGHATSFRGSDTLIVIPAARYYYGEPADGVAINSVNASEHSVSTTKIFTVGEQQMIADWLKLFPTGILSIVGDTFDLFSLITEYLPANKEAIMNRNGKLVIRPDSGDPVDIICGMDNYRVIGDKVYDVVDCGDHAKSWRQTTTYNINQIKGVIELLWDIFGGTINEQGYKVLDPHIGAIYGDSINLQSQIKIYEKLEAKGFATTNIVLGVGSFTYQMNTRDTLGFAAKGSWFATDDEEYNIYKDPITDDGTKKSLKGRVAVNPHFTVKTECTVEEEAGGILQTIYENGTFTKLTTLTEIRETINGIV